MISNENKLRFVAKSIRATGSFETHSRVCEDAANEIQSLKNQIAQLEKIALSNSDRPASDDLVYLTGQALSGLCARKDWSIGYSIRLPNDAVEMAYEALQIIKTMKTSGDLDSVIDGK